MLQKVKSREVNDNFQSLRVLSEIIRNLKGGFWNDPTLKLESSFLWVNLFYILPLYYHSIVTYSWNRLNNNVVFI